MKSYKKRKKTCGIKRFFHIKKKSIFARKTDLHKLKARNNEK